MSIVEKFYKSIIARVQEFTRRWWTERDEENQNFFYHVDDAFYELGLRKEAEELLEIVFASFLGDNREQMHDWSVRCGRLRAAQNVPADEAVERFRMFRRILVDYFYHFAEAEQLSATECMRIAEQLTNHCELAMQNFMTQYMLSKEQFMNEERKRFDMERLASIGQMAAGVAHEVRNPLTATRGFLQLLAETQPHHFLEIAMQELDRGIDTISTLLDVAKPNVPQAPKRPVSLAKMLRQVLEIFQDKLYSMRVLLELQDEEFLLEAQGEALKQAFFNVVKNAVESMKGKPDASLVIRHRREGEFLIVEVQDNGEGIPPEKLHLLGTPFFTLKDDGVGLGLTMVYRTMHEHFAQVTVTSQRGQGTLFRFTFPVQ
jgi:signal transduction histidine kinase